MLPYLSSLGARFFIIITVIVVLSIIIIVIFKHIYIYYELFILKYLQALE